METLNLRVPGSMGRQTQRGFMEEGDVALHLEG